MPYLLALPVRCIGGATHPIPALIAQRGLMSLFSIL